MVAVSHYGMENDISGVTTWLGLLLAELQEQGLSVGVNLEHFGNDGSRGSLFLHACQLAIPSSWTPRSGDTRQDVKGVLQFLNQVRPAVFLPQCLPSAHFAARLAQRHGLPWVFTLHSDDPAYWALAEHAGPDSKHGIWVAVSEEIARVARVRYPKADIRVIPCGVKNQGQHSGWNEERFRIVYSGRMVEEQKRISKVIETLIIACGLSKHIEAVVVGDGPEREKMMARVVAAGMSDQIRFAGRLAPEDVTGELLQAQAIVLMSDYEGLPVCLLEAMVCGVVPVVRAIRSGIPEIVRDGETGLLVEDDPAEAAAVLVKLSTQRESWERMSRTARELVIQGYSHEQCMKKWLGILEELRGRSQVVYPLQVPRRPKLPPRDERLKDYDQRLPCATAKMAERVFSFPRRLIRKLKQHF